VHGGEFLPLDEEKMGAVHGWIRFAGKGFLRAQAEESWREAMA